MEGYISNVECACGCGNLMPQHLVDRGWRFLHGHKPKKSRAQIQVPKHEPVSQIGLDQVMDFALKNVELLTDQLEKHRTDAQLAKLCCDVLERQVAQWQTMLDNARMLAGIVEPQCQI